MQYKVLSTVGPHDAGAIVDEDQLRGAERAAELVQRGVVEPYDMAPPAANDAKGWRKLAEAREKEIAKLRMATPEAGHVARIGELEESLAAEKAAHGTTKTSLAELSEAVVPIAQHKQVIAQLEQLTELHKTTVAELEALQAK